CLRSKQVGTDVSRRESVHIFCCHIAIGGNIRRVTYRGCSFCDVLPRIREARKTWPQRKRRNGPQSRSAPLRLGRSTMPRRSARKLARRPVRKLARRPVRKLARRSARKLARSAARRRLASPQLLTLLPLNESEAVLSAA